MCYTLTGKRIVVVVEQERLHSGGCSVVRSLSTMEQEFERRLPKGEHCNSRGRAQEQWRAISSWNAKLKRQYAQRRRKVRDGLSSIDKDVLCLDNRSYLITTAAMARKGRCHFYLNNKVFDPNEMTSSFLLACLSLSLTIRL